MPTIKIENPENLSPYIKEENLRFATEKLASFLGIKKRITLNISVRTIEYKDGLNLLGYWHGVSGKIFVYDRMMRIWCARKRSRSILKIYAEILCHEMAHMQQEVSGRIHYLPMKPKDISEKEALALEKVYKPIVLKYLRSGPK